MARMTVVVTGASGYVAGRMLEALRERLAAFAEESVVFERHHTEAPSSGIAYASILSGGQADHHGVYRHPLRLSPDLILLPEVFAEDTPLNYRMMDHVDDFEVCPHDNKANPSPEEVAKNREKWGYSG